MAGYTRSARILGSRREFGYTHGTMLFPDQSPVVLITVFVGLLALGLLAAARDLLGQRGAGLVCPKCGQAFDPRRWPSHNERVMYHGRYTVTPHYTCPRCGETARMEGA